ncbi:hypothetical protein SPRG_22226 [Saprolegnia parasitica CBS 223.65]|uniref:FZ domain-containing protein n=1 Tax=Saprolegnia parasitica (strain CBS 223.65) TaxID=695850 RepID=A0A067C8M8_SAPPC|nr:hypothetical protein SPRG_22226 [Saprolegnia parasitica CBS 223.65]KDO25520.1 hypothetical protein SPRG_22226 [Saprolegnia parasitica CBS 223.65]|eukprot:XP_012203793.1 hypothetical protein SPRG_22226 [Saprolegnia parasitica CBS 223.65]
MRGSLVWLAALRGLMACRIMGSNTGECQAPSVFLQYMPFCGPLLQYTACVPEAQTIWYNHSVKSKDLFLSQMYRKLVMQREYFEQDVDLNDAQRDEWGNAGEIVPRFTENRDCQDAFRNYMCWLNFPRCDDAGVSLIMCRSVCENYFKACMQAKDLWRCGDPAYVNGYEPEISTYANNVAGELQYYRFPFPGSPFRTNAFTSDGTQALPVCTPSLLNGASSMYDVLQWLHMVVLATWLVVFFL